MRREATATIALLLVASQMTHALADSDADRAALSAYLDRALSEDDGFEDRFTAEVWLVDMQQRLAPFVADPRERLDLLTQIHQQATQLNLPPELVLSVIEVESGFDRYALSKAGAQGLMQVMPFWKDEIGRPDDNLTHMPDQSSLRLLHSALLYLDREDQNWRRALAAYNGSSGSQRYPDKVRSAWESHWRTAPLDW